MKTPTIIVSLLLTLVAHGATSVRFDGENHRHHSIGSNGEQQQNEDFGLSSYSQEAIDEDIDSSSDVTDNFEIATNTQNIKKHHHNSGNSNANNRFSESDNENKENNNNQFGSNRNSWSHGQSVRSSESFMTADESGEQHRTENDAIVDDGSSTIVRNLVAKITALDGIVAQEHRRNGNNLLTADASLPVKKSVVKVSKQNFVSFQNSTLRDLKAGHLEYLSIDPVADRVYAECAFDRLTADGAFKTNLPHTKQGRFAVDLEHVRSNVTAGFHRGRYAAKPAVESRGPEAAAVRVMAEDRTDERAIADAVNRKYGEVLQKTVSAQVYESTHRAGGMVARLKQEMKSSPQHPDAAGKLFDMNWTEDKVNMQMTGIAASGRSEGRKTIDSMSYTRLAGENAYKTRFDVAIEAPRWTGDLAVTVDGQCVRARAIDFAADNVRIHAVVFRSLADQKCGKIEAQVQLNGLRYDLNADKRFPEAMKSVVQQRLSQFIRRSLAAYVKNSIKRDVCLNNNNNNA